MVGGVTGGGGLETLRYEVMGERRGGFGRVGARCRLGLAVAGVEDVARGAAGQEFAHAHRHAVGGEVGEPEDHHRQRPEGGRGAALGLGAGKARDDGKGGDDAVIAAVDDLLEIGAQGAARSEPSHGHPPAPS